MIYLSGCVNDALPPSVGLMLTPAIGNTLPESRIWAADTGCFAQPDRFDPLAYLDWLSARASAADRCLFATAPDRFGDGLATLAAALPWLSRIRAVGFRSSIVAQPGMTVDLIPWSDIDALFIGGPNHWQYSDAVIALAQEARRRELWVHRGRVNSLRRLSDARRMGCDSADGTFASFGPDKNIPRIGRWLDALAVQPDLFTL